jgi:hypothetical protein
VSDCEVPADRVGTADTGVDRCDRTGSAAVPPGAAFAGDATSSDATNDAATTMACLARGRIRGKSDHNESLTDDAATTASHAITTKRARAALGG